MQDGKGRVGRTGIDLFSNGRESVLGNPKRKNVMTSAVSVHVYRHQHLFEWSWLE
jgi:hypothetical protein